MSVEITVNDKFFDPNNCSDYERLRVREYILKEFIGMAHQPQPPEKKLKELSKYLHSNFPECFDLLSI
jgi:hypothetical protein|tara:strand:+ start:662 stop:865 length:204 start_codon:yes stop_codon:yes gene_type:complete